jgi:SAM-dependent methyltransferase
MRALIASLLMLLGCAGADPPPEHQASRTENEHDHASGSGHGSGSDHGHGHGHAHGEGHGPPGDDHGGVLVHRFQNAEQWSKEFDDPARDAWQRPADVVALLRITEGMTAVDLGAGTGYFLPHLARAVGPRGTVLALDVEADMVRYMRERAAREKLANVKPTQVSPQDPGLPAASVDRILIVDTWHHIPNREPYTAKLRTALKPCGTIAVVDFTLESKRGPPKKHRIPPDRVAAELTATGLTTEVAKEDLPDQYVVLGKAPGTCP